MKYDYSPAQSEMKPSSVLDSINNDLKGHELVVVDVNAGGQHAHVLAHHARPLVLLSALLVCIELGPQHVLGFVAGGRVEAFALARVLRLGPPQTRCGDWPTRTHRVARDLQPS